MARPVLRAVAYPVDDQIPMILAGAHFRHEFLDGHSQIRCNDRRFSIAKLANRGQGIAAERDQTDDFGDFPVPDCVAMGAIDVVAKRANASAMSFFPPSTRTAARHGM